MSIKFKKLVWVETGHSHECYTTPFRFVIYEENEGLFLLETHSYKGLEQRAFCQHLNEAKDHAQTFLEIKLTQFIETSEDPDQ